MEYPKGLTLEKLKKIKGMFDRAEMPETGAIWNPKTNKVVSYKVTKPNQLTST